MNNSETMPTPLNGNSIAERGEELRTQIAKAIDSVKGKLDFARNLAVGAKGAVSKASPLEIGNAMGQITTTDLEPIYQAINELKAMQKADLQRKLADKRNEMVELEGALEVITAQPSRF